MSISGTQWLARYASALGVEAPHDEEVQTLLALAGVVAHASERTAAPVSTWLAARANMSAPEALEVARRLADEADGEG